MPDSKKNREARRRHITSLLDAYSTSSFWTRSFGIVMESEEPQFYQEMRARWSEIVQNNQHCAQVWANFAFFLTFSEIDEAQKLALKASQLDGANPEIVRTLNFVNKAAMKRR